MTLTTMPPALVPIVSEAVRDIVRIRLHLPALLAAGVTSSVEPHADRVAVLPVGAPGAAHVELFDPLTHGAEAQRARLDGVPLVALVQVRTAESEAHARSLGAARVLTLDVAGDVLVQHVEEAARADLSDADSSTEPLASLSPRELEVIGHICRGLTNEAIARELYLSVNSVKTYVRHAYRKIGAGNRAQAVVWGLRHGF